MPHFWTTPDKLTKSRNQLEQIRKRKFQCPFMGASQQNKTRACSCGISSGMRYRYTYYLFITQFVEPCVLPHCPHWNRFGRPGKWLNMYVPKWICTKMAYTPQFNREPVFLLWNVSGNPSWPFPNFRSQCLKSHRKHRKPPWLKPDYAISCASCASPATAFAAPSVLSVGAMESCWEVLWTKWRCNQQNMVSSLPWLTSSDSWILGWITGLHPTPQLKILGFSLPPNPSKAPTFCIPFVFQLGYQEVLKTSRCMEPPPSKPGEQGPDGEPDDMWRLNDPCRSTILRRAAPRPNLEFLR